MIFMFLTHHLLLMKNKKFHQNCVVPLESYASDAKNRKGEGEDRPSMILSKQLTNSKAYPPFQRYLFSILCEVKITELTSKEIRRVQRIYWQLRKGVFFQRSPFKKVKLGFWWYDIIKWYIFLLAYVRAWLVH